MNLTLRLMALAALLSMAGCSSSPKSKQTAETPTPAPIVTQAVEPPPQVVDGSATDDQRTIIQKSNTQIYGAEHAMSPGTSDDSHAQNQGIP
jgi:type IV pilus biogenesis protein CpaD/CtpE